MANRWIGQYEGAAIETCYKESQCIGNERNEPHSGGLKLSICIHVASCKAPPGRRMAYGGHPYQRVAIYIFHLRGILPRCAVRLAGRSVFCGQEQQRNPVYKQFARRVQFHIFSPPVGRTYPSLQSFPEHLPASCLVDTNETSRPALCPHFNMHLSSPPRAQRGNPILCYSSDTQKWTNDHLQVSL